MLLLALVWLAVAPALSLAPPASRLLRTEPTWGLRERLPRTTLLDVVSVLGRFRRRQDFFEGEGYQRPSSGLLSDESFFARMQARRFDPKLWPVDETGELIGCAGLSNDEREALRKGLMSADVSREGCRAVFTSFAKGAANGVAYPIQVDEEMSKWLTVSDQGRLFDIRRFEQSLLVGKVNVAFAWVLFVGLNTAGVWIIVSIILKTLEMKS